MVGLGNPGDRYARTRHNLGFVLADRIARRNGCQDWRTDRDLVCKVAEIEVAGGRQTLIKPLTYMNRSGVSVARTMVQREMGLDQVLALVDDVALPLGRVRLRRGGSHGGHKGLLSIIEETGSEGFARLRMGIGPLPDQEDLVDFVLGEFSDKEVEVAEAMVERAARAVEAVICDGIERAMDVYNIA